MLRDFNVDWLRKRVYIGVNEFSGVVGSASIGSGTRTLAAINSKVVATLPWTANTDTVEHLMMLPYDIDITKAIDFRLHWSCNQAVAMQWTMKYDQFGPAANSELVTSGYDPGLANLGTIADAATALTVASVTGTTGFQWLTSGLISIARNVLLKTSYGIVILVGASGTLPTSTSLIGLEMRYSTRQMVGPRRNIVGGRRLSDVMGVQWMATHQEGL